MNEITVISLSKRYPRRIYRGKPLWDFTHDLTSDQTSPSEKFKYSSTSWLGENSFVIKRFLFRLSKVKMKKYFNSSLGLPAHVDGVTRKGLKSEKNCLRYLIWELYLRSDSRSLLHTWWVIWKVYHFMIRLSCLTFVSVKNKIYGCLKWERRID